MKTGALSVGLLDRAATGGLRSVASTDELGRALVALQDERQHGRAPAIEALCNRYGLEGSVTALAALVKAELRCRYAAGECPAIAEYLERFPLLRQVHDRVVSLVYEEFCLREEQGEELDADQFCARYEPWRDSLVSQLRYHRLLSQVVAPPAPPRFPEPGDDFQGFRLRAVLGKGGVARVYLACDPALGDREVALKVSPDRGKEPSIQARLDHAHIVPVLSVTSADPATGLRGLCMPYRSGASLDEVIQWLDPASQPRRARALWDALASQGRAQWERGPKEAGWQSFPAGGSYAEGVAWVVLTLARALEHAHARGVLHRDVKPANVLLTFRDGPQLLDFNLAHEPNNAERAEAALRGGTLPYMAPEQLEAFLDPSQWEKVGPSADLYALGLLLGELLTGERPDAPDPTLPLPRAIAELLDRRAERTPSLRELNPTVPPALDAIAARCLAYAPSKRYAHAAELIEDLERFLERRPLVHAPNTSRLERTRNWARRNRLAIGLAATILVVVGLARLVVSHDMNPAPTYVAYGITNMGYERWDEAEKMFKRALELDDKLFTVYQGLAAVEAHRRNHDREYTLLGRSITLAESAKPAVPGWRIAELYQARAAASLRRGNQLQLPVTKQAFLAAQPYYVSAMADLDRARQLGGNERPQTRFNIIYDSAWAELGLGDVCSYFDNYEDSVSHFTRAEGFLKQALALEPQNAYPQSLSLEVKGRLKVDGPILERLRSERSKPAGSPTRASAPTSDTIPAGD